MAPELHTEDLPLVTEHSDIYAFASTALQILTGDVPYAYIRQEHKVIAAVRSNQLPLRPSGVGEVGDGVWGVLEGCWGWKPEGRMRMRAVKVALGV